jgi:uncharacterized membrane protein YbhN (UPF0104 family)
VLVLSICVAPRAICYPLLQWSCRFGRFRPIAERLIRILHTINVLLRLEPFLIGLTLAILAWGCEALAFNVLVQRVPVEIPFVASFAIVGLAAVVGALSMLPGGVGGVGAVMMLLLGKARGRFALGYHDHHRISTLYPIFWYSTWILLLGLMESHEPRGKAGVAFGAGLTLRLQAQGTS